MEFYGKKIAIIMSCILSYIESKIPEGYDDEIDLYNIKEVNVCKYFMISIIASMISLLIFILMLGLCIIGIGHNKEVPEFMLILGGFVFTSCISISATLADLFRMYLCCHKRPLFYKYYIWKSESYSL